METLAGLRQQDLAAGDFEIIVVDDGSTPPVVLEDGAGGPACNVVRLEGMERSTARNAGAAAASGNVLVFLDDDMTVNASFLANHLCAHADWPSALVVGSVSLPAEALATPFGRFRQNLEQKSVPRSRGITSIPNFCTAANMSVPKPLFDELRGFDQDMTSGEDQDLALRHSAGGGMIVFIPEALAVHNDSALDIRSYCRRSEWGNEHRIPFQQRYTDRQCCIEQRRVNGPLRLAREPFGLSARKLVKSILAHDAILAMIFRFTTLVEGISADSAMLDWLYRVLLGVHLFRGHRRGIGYFQPGTPEAQPSGAVEKARTGLPVRARQTDVAIRRPNLFIVGAPKCGTTTMYHLLARHPDVFMCPVKEPHFFGSDLSYYPGYIRDEEEYLSLFAGATQEKFVGEASTWYLFSKRACIEIKEFCPEARIIIMLRNPVEMIHSLHSQRLYDCNESITDFRAAVEADEERKRGLWMPRSFGGSVGVYLYREVGKYAAQVERYFEEFGRQMVQVVIFDDLENDPAGVFQSTCEFLGINSEMGAAVEVSNANKKLRSMALGRFLQSPPGFARSAFRTIGPPSMRRKLYDAIKRWNVRVEPRTAMAPEIAGRLRNEFAPDIRRLSALLARDLSRWTT